MMRKLFFSTTIAGLLCAYVAMLYALVHIVVIINDSYLLSLAK